MINARTNVTIHVVLFPLGEVVDLRQQSLALLLFFSFWLPHVVKDARWSKLFEELGPSLHHMSLVRLNAVLVPFLQLCWRRPKSQEMKT
jgi:hypothetical protein